MIALNTDFYFDTFLDVLFSLGTRLPVSHGMHCARLLRHAPASILNRSNGHFFGGRSEPLALLEQPVKIDAWT